MKTAFILFFEDKARITVVFIPSHILLFLFLVVKLEDQVARAPSGALKHLFSPPSFNPPTLICPIHEDSHPVSLAASSSMLRACEYMYAHVFWGFKSLLGPHMEADKGEEEEERRGLFHTHRIHGAACSSLAQGQTCTRSPIFMQLIKLGGERASEGGGEKEV